MKGILTFFLYLAKNRTTPPTPRLGARDCRQKLTLTKRIHSFPIPWNSLETPTQVQTATNNFYVSKQTAHRNIWLLQAHFFFFFPKWARFDELVVIKSRSSLIQMGFSPAPPLPVSLKLMRLYLSHRDAVRRCFEVISLQAELFLKLFQAHGGLHSSASV